ERLAPHLHMLVGLPAQVSEEEFGYLQARRRRRVELEAAVGKREGRRKMGAPRGEFCDWLHRTWAGVVVGSQERWLIGDVTPVYWSEGAFARTDSEVVAEYLWRETGKERQKESPAGFRSVSLYGTWKGKGKW